ncbi:ATP phosphoribosyltransferase regulatory subunit [Desulfuribacillus stibiiarsenatis]|uniref:ATP phosphoribosyltransferase regulatory subunit n=1 Tax=Desulfuribacillus stibiiarsenatis TaxID=1390249 RepID=A0A1E5L9R9_9FIRM|nr:ATP phosphoribosyltransferase regulatory subunit [Desulfuribacillus stibiiarsenatis]OEH86808.1 ATP phosphoribosyltransferase regulatory subunit [Desulfuribacillus stibiiarsenatis]
MAKPLVFEKPFGVRDYLPSEVQWKKEVERRISSCMERWGYKEIITPALEYLDTVGDSSNILQNRLYKLIDRNGKTLVLRPDMTTPIARVAASLLKDEPLPLRLCYNATIYRMQEKEAGRDTEFFQSGVELIGIEQPYADAEVIALAAESLIAAGLYDFKIAIGETTFLQSLLSEKAPQHLEELKSLLLKQDYVGWKTFVETIDLDESSKECLRALPRLQGGREMIAKAKGMVQDAKGLEALDHLEAVWSILEQYGVAQYVHIDFTTLRGQNYYTGMIFEVYTPSVGFPICGGGRYDDLLHEFGRKAPAVGFGMWLERLIDALNMETNAADTYLFIFDHENVKESQAVIEQAKRWRNVGCKVEIIGVAKEQSNACVIERQATKKYREVWTYDMWASQHPTHTKEDESTWKN